MSDATVTIRATYLRSTDKAILVRIDAKEIWVPKSVVDGGAMHGTSLTLAEWWYNKNVA